MTFAEAETKVARLAAEENCYILMARGLEDKAAEFKKLASHYRNLANKLADEQQRIWQEFNP